MAGQDPKTNMAATEPQPNPPAANDNGPKGEPDAKAQIARLTQERDDWKSKAETAEGQLKTVSYTHLDVYKRQT